ncbi:YbaB/EbfC family nucleoid-associated protein [Mycoplasmopsis gallinarum]|uniref:Nucleoid-associated protein n=1 Tax=Mycoplasmopsis gallinarum TaxID=29557 RepID=A0A168R7N0_9BACT|nr:YbaB/EbfC family nucleoid-associated protein [Mycoplasmopsis gallinarum]OAB48684.1 hypothetical protein MGALLINA_05710 [Mycoplasmopsis gallinarum]
MDLGMLRKMQKLQKEIEAKTEEFNEKEFTLEKHGIEIVAKGSKKIISIKFKEVFLLDPEDAETTEDLLVLLINQLYEQIDEEEKQLMPAMPNGLGF